MLAAALVIAASWTMPAFAETRPVLLPLTFQNWGVPVRTDACFQLGETLYPSQAASQKWTGFGFEAGPVEKALEQVLAAMVKKDKDELLRLSDPGMGRQPGQFDQQATAYFQQFETLRVTNVPFSYAFGPYTVFFVRMKLPERFLFVPFVFHRWAEGEFGFLPSRTDELAYRFLIEWFDSPWGPQSVSQPAYCAAGGTQSFAYRIRIYSADAGPAATVFLNGAPLSNPGPLKSVAEQVETAYAHIKRSLNTANWQSEISKQLDEKGAERLNKWFHEAEPAAQQQYRDALLEQSPFFVFDALPIAVVFTASNDHKKVQVLYFNIVPGRGAVWMNSSYASTADRLFRSGPLFESAALPRPFSSMENK